MEWLRGDVEVLAVAMFLFFGYIMLGAKNYGSVGFLIPTAILSMIYITENYVIVAFPGFDGMLMTMSIGLAFIAVFLLHTVRFKGQWNRFWPLVTGIVIILFGALEGVVDLTQLQWLNGILNNLGALFLIVIGLWLAFYKGRKHD